MHFENYLMILEYIEEYLKNDPFLYRTVEMKKDLISLKSENVVTDSTTKCHDYANIKLNFDYSKLLKTRLEGLKEENLGKVKQEENPFITRKNFDLAIREAIANFFLWLMRNCAGNTINKNRTDCEVILKVDITEFYKQIKSDPSSSKKEFSKLFI